MAGSRQPNPLIALAKQLSHDRKSLFISILGSVISAPIILVIVAYLGLLGYSVSTFLAPFGLIFGLAFGFSLVHETTQLVVTQAKTLSRRFLVYLAATISFTVFTCSTVLFAINDNVFTIFNHPPIAVSTLRHASISRIGVTVANHGSTATLTIEGNGLNKFQPPGDDGDPKDRASGANGRQIDILVFTDPGHISSSTITTTHALTTDWHACYTGSSVRCYVEQWDQDKIVLDLTRMNPANLRITTQDLIMLTLAYDNARSPDARDKLIVVTVPTVPTIDNQ